MWILGSLTTQISEWILSENNHNPREFPSGQNLADSVGDPWGFWWLVEGIHAEVRVVSGTRLHVEIHGIFLNGG